MLLTKEVEINLVSSNIKYYENLGYKIPRVKSKYGKWVVPQNTKLIVNIKHLPKNSSVYINFLCDYCSEISTTNFYAYNNKNTQKDCCNKCKSKVSGTTRIKQNKLKNTTDKIKNDFIFLYNKLGRCPTLKDINNERKINKDFISNGIIKKYFKSIYILTKECNLHKQNLTGYTKQELINALKGFVKEFNRIPVSSDFNKLEGYPSRKTFSNIFGDFNTALREAGLEPTKLSDKEYNDKYRNKEYLSQIIFDFIGKYNKIPTFKEMTKEYNHGLKLLYKQVYGSWNNALKELSLPLNSVSQYSEEFLELEFHRFVKEKGRIPTYIEFNNSEYPSFWCYQNRFGSWNKAVVSYGYEINDSNRKHTLDNGEICESSYEFDISNWLRNNNITYLRNIPYIDFIDNYKGRMDCDYKIIYNNEIWYVEMAGFLSGTDFSKFSEAEKKYFFKLKYKRKLLCRQGVNYIIIEPCDLKKKSMEEIFYFIK